MDIELLEFFMREAIALAQKGRFRAYPNPATGAVLVKNAQIVARGWHKKAGEDHAEIACLKDAASKGIDPAGALMVVTLEPCAHYGRTPPCADAIAKARIGSLAYGVADPNPVAKGGAQKLSESGITVFGPVLEQKCRDLIADFTIWQCAARPYVILKMAASLDGRIATANGDARWISGPDSRRSTHELRSLVGAAGGAILIGGETFRQDDPALTARIEGSPNLKQPLACVITSQLREAENAKLTRERPADAIFITTREMAGSPEAERLRKSGCSMLVQETNENGGVNLEKALINLRQTYGCPYVLCEGGGKLALSLLENSLVDEFHLHLAPIILGEAGARPLFSGRALNSLQDALKMRICSFRQNGDDLNLILRPK